MSLLLYLKIMYKKNIYTYTNKDFHSTFFNLNILSMSLGYRYIKKVDFEVF